MIYVFDSLLVTLILNMKNILLNCGMGSNSGLIDGGKSTSNSFHLALIAFIALHAAQLVRLASNSFSILTQSFHITLSTCKFTTILELFPVFLQDLR